MKNTQPQHHKSFLLAIEVLDFVLLLSSVSVSTILVELFLPDSDLFGSDLHKLVVPHIANSVLDGESSRWYQNDFLIVRVGSDVGYLFLSSCIDLDILLFVILANNQTVVHFLTCSDEQ